MKLSKDKLKSWQLSLLFGLTLAGYPAVAALSTIVGFDNRIASIGYRVALLGICASILLGSRWSSPKAERLAIWFLLLFFWLLYTARIIWDGYLISSLLNRSPHIYLVFAIGGCFVPMLAFMLIGKPGEYVLDKVREASFYAVFLASIMVLWVYYHSLGLSAAMNSSRLSLEVLNPISAGHLGGSLVILSGFCLLERLTNGTKLANVLTYWLALCVGMVLLVASASRGPIVATSLALGAYAVSRLNNRSGLLKSVAVAAFFVGGFWLAAVVESRLGFSSVSRVINLIEQGSSDASTSSRITLIGSAWEQFLSSPLLGSGLEERYSRFYPHNVIVEAFMATGLLGGISFLMILAAAAMSSWSIMVRRSTAGWIAMICIQYLIAAQFSGSIWAATGLWSLIGGVFAARIFNRSPNDQLAGLGVPAR